MTNSHRVIAAPRNSGPTPNKYPIDSFKEQYTLPLGRCHGKTFCLCHRRFSRVTKTQTMSFVGVGGGGGEGGGGESGTYYAQGR